MNELKPCPFCDSAAEIRRSSSRPSDTMVFPHCTACDANIDGWYPLAAAIAAWNTRPAETIALADLATAQREVERLRDALERYGWHDNTCPIYSNVHDPCTCGFTLAARSATAGEE